MTTRDSHIGSNTNTVCPIKSQLIHFKEATTGLALGMALLPHLEGLFQASAWYDGSTSTAMVKEI